MLNQNRIHNSAEFHSPTAMDYLRAAVAQIKRIHTAIENRRNAQVLFGMTDHELKDIGVTRNDVHREVMKPLVQWWR